MRNTHLDSQTVEGFHLERLAEIASSNGVDVDRLLLELGLERAAFANPRMRYSLRTFYKFVSEVEQRGKVDGLGFAMGLQQGPLASGMYGYGVISSDTLGKGLRFAERYVALASTELRLKLTTVGNVAILRVTPRFPLGEQLTYVIEEWIANHYLASRLLIGGPIRYLSAHFAYSRPGSASCYARFLPCSIFFDAPENEVRFPHSELDRVFANANPAVHNLAVGYCETVLRQARDDDLVNQVRVRISAALRSSPSLDEIASEIGVGVRTLRRRLRLHGASYQSLLNQIRMDLGTFYLSETDLSPAQIAYELGYDEVTTFYRRFKSWSARTPIAFREEQRKKKVRWSDSRRNAQAGCPVAGTEKAGKRVGAKGRRPPLAPNSPRSGNTRRGR